MPDANGHRLPGDEWPWENCQYCKGTGYKDGDLGAPLDVPDECPHCATENGSWGRVYKKGWVWDEKAQCSKWVGAGSCPQWSG